MALTKTQLNYLQQEILRHKHNMTYSRQPDLPARVKRAQQVIYQWNEQEAQKRSEFRTKVEAEARKCQEALLFAEGDEALRIVKEFQKFKG
jgi:hypothetical protein